MDIYNMFTLIPSYPVDKLADRRYWKLQKVHWLLIKKVIYCVLMYEATMGFFLFLVILVCRGIIICETGSGFIFSPRGLSHCCGRLVDDIWDGISFKPAIFHCSISNMMGRTCVHWPDTLFGNYIVSLIINILPPKNYNNAC